MLRIYQITASKLVLVEFVLSKVTIIIFLKISMILKYISAHEFYENNTHFLYSDNSTTLAREI